MKKMSLSVVLALAACSHPTSACPANQTECGSVCANLQASSSNCGACGTVCPTDQACVAGQCVFDTCTQPDVYAACWNGGGLVGICSVSGQQEPAATVEGPVPDGGGNGEVVSETQNLVFAGPTTLWALDVANAQIDILDTSVWPPTVKGSLWAGTEPFDPVAMIGCGTGVLLARSEPPVVDLFNAATGALVNEVSLVVDGGYPYPNALACAGNTVYVADSIDNVLLSIDLPSSSVQQILGLPAFDQMAPASLDGGIFTFFPSVSELAVTMSSDEGPPTVFAALQNYAVFDSSDGGEIVRPVEDSTVIQANGSLTSFGPPLDLGACFDVFGLAVSLDQSTLYAPCAGKFHIAGQPNATSELGVVTAAGPVAQPSVTLPLSNPGEAVVLKNGLVAVGDNGQAKIAFYNPADGGVTTVAVACPGLPDGGVDPLQFVSALVPAP